MKWPLRDRKFQAQLRTSVQGEFEENSTSLSREIYTCTRRESQIVQRVDHYSRGTLNSAHHKLEVLEFAGDKAEAKCL